ncbi:hypothetical protein SUGI_1507950 [Cryptomeria japonica]|uniref:Uncharacterized protein n=1 Tax=Cryptomeria japonica TaxID=3369 RepID=A0AAD3RRP4_CRYJA|nr:hypothetical protein SUGI_1507950 [Cryptomeria japonica]
MLHPCTGEDGRMGREVGLESLLLLASVPSTRQFGRYGDRFIILLPGVMMLPKRRFLQLSSALVGLASFFPPAIVLAEKSFG